MAKGKLVYRGKFYSVYESGSDNVYGKFFLYRNSINKPLSTHRSLAVAKRKATLLNKRVSSLPWWDRE